MELWTGVNTRGCQQVMAGVLRKPRAQGVASEQPQIHRKETEKTTVDSTSPGFCIGKLRLREVDMAGHCCQSVSVWLG